MTENRSIAIRVTALQSAAKILCDRDIGILPVLTDDDFQSLVGIITDRDLLSQNGRQEGLKSERQQREAVILVQQPREEFAALSRV